MVYDYKARKRQIVVQEGLSIVDPHVCDRYKDISHVVTEVTYGFDAHMVFEKSTNEDFQNKQISGSLDVLIKSLPSIQIEGHASMNFTEAETTIKNTLEFKFFGDAIIDPPPATFDDAIEVTNYPQLISSEN